MGSLNRLAIQHIWVGFLREVAVSHRSYCHLACQPSHGLWKLRRLRRGLFVFGLLRLSPPSTLLRWGYNHELPFMDVEVALWLQLCTLQRIPVVGYFDWRKMRTFIGVVMFTLSRLMAWYPDSLRRCLLFVLRSCRRYGVTVWYWLPDRDRITGNSVFSFFMYFFKFFHDRCLPRISHGV